MLFFFPHQSSVLILLSSPKTGNSDKHRRCAHMKHIRTTLRSSLPTHPLSRSVCLTNNRFWCCWFVWRCWMAAEGVLGDMGHLKTATDDWAVKLGRQENRSRPSYFKMSRALILGRKLSLHEIAAGFANDQGPWQLVIWHLIHFKLKTLCENVPWN